MPISPQDLKEYKSSQANSDGGSIDLARKIPSGGIDNLWSDITSVQAAAGGTDYRKAFRRNESALTWSAVRSWLLQQPQGPVVSVGIGAPGSADATGVQGNMTALSGPSRIFLVSDGADTRMATVIGEDNSGNRLVETVTLTSATPVGTVATFGKVYAVQLSATDPSRTVTVTEGSGGPTRGVIGPTFITCWLWRSTDLLSSSQAYQHGDIPAGSSFSLWFRRVWAPGIGSVQGTNETTRSEGGTPP